MNGPKVDRIFTIRYKPYSVLPCATFGICAILPPFLTHLRHRAFRAAKTSRRLPETIGPSWLSSGRFSTSLENGARASTKDSWLSSVSYLTARAKNHLIVYFPHQVTPHIGDLSVQVRQAILARIRRCGRIGDEREARWLYIVHGVGFRQYRSAYETGRQEARRVRTEQEGRA